MSKWISVTERLPPYNKDVLTYNPYMAVKMIVDEYMTYFGEDDFNEHTGWRQRNEETEKPTHWCELPEPPSEE